MKLCHFDFETYGTAPLGSRGVDAHRYANDPETEIICMAWAIEDDKPVLWRPGMPVPLPMREPDAFTFCAHNAPFEFTVWNALGHKHGWARCPPPSSWLCTASMAAALSLPRSLGGVGAVLGLQEDAKDPKGRRLKNLLCSPGKNGHRNQDPSEMKKLYAYCLQDVVAERAVKKKLIPLINSEKVVWQRDLVINARGIPVDRKFTQKAISFVARAKKDLDKRCDEVTNGLVPNTRKRVAVLDYAEAYGYPMKGLTKADVENALKDKTLPREVRAILEIRQLAGRTSVQKFDALDRLSDLDARARGLLLYCGANTGRWSGKFFQPQNLPRPTLKGTPLAIETLLNESYETFALFYPDVLEALGSLVRSAVCALPGKVLIAGDWSAIEARVLAWLAAQEDVVEVFRTTGKIYEHTASQIYGIPADQIAKDSDERFTGKTATLALGYQGGWKAFVKYAEATGLDLEAMFARSPAKQRAAALRIRKEFAARKRGAVRLSPGEAMAELIKIQWRRANDKIVNFWHGVESAAMDAIAAPGEVTRVGLIRFKVSSGILFCRLPSGRKLAYWKPTIKAGKFGKDQVNFWGVDDRTLWAQQTTYGGKLVENIVQAVSRDILAEGILRAERHAYPVILHVHDEIVTEVDEDFGSAEDLERIMCTNPVWAEGLPLAAGAWRGKRYRK